jgi:hypothetical protein
MSAAVTLPEGPTAAQSHSVMLPLPPPSSRHRQPWPTPSPASYRRVQGSRILDRELRQDSVNYGGGLVRPGWSRSVRAV